MSKLTVAELKANHQAADAAAREAHEAFKKAREPLGSDDFDVKSDVGRDLFKKAEEFSNEYGRKSQEAEEAKSLYISELEMRGHETDALKGRTPFSPSNDDQRKALELADLSPGRRVVESEGYKAMIADGGYLREKSHFSMDPAAALSRDEHIFQLKSGMLGGLEQKTLATSFGAPGTELLRPTRLPGYLPLLQPKLQLRNLISVGAIDNNAIEWVKMTAITNNAAEVAEATATSGSSGSKPESGFEFAVESTTVKTIAHFIPATRASLADMAQLQTIIDSLLLDGVARRLNGQILAGDGSAPNLLGILNTDGLLSQDDTVLGTSGARKIERILAAITQIRLAFLEPSAILMNPLDFEEIRLKRDGTENYYFGSPAVAGETTLWGLPIIQDTTCTAGQPVVADWSQAILYVREEVNVLATDSHSDWFTRNLIAILAEGRYALAVPRPDAFCEVDFTTDES